MKRQKIALAVDVGGTKLAAALVAENGRVLARHQVPTNHAVSADALFQSVLELTQSVIDSESNFDVCGVGCGGPMRHGGMSDDILSGRRDRKTVKARGRWRTDASLNRYGNPGAVNRLLNAMTASSREFGKHMFELMGSLFQGTVAATAIPK